MELSDTAGTLAYIKAWLEMIELPESERSENFDSQLALVEHLFDQSLERRIAAHLNLREVERGLGDLPG